MLRSICIILSIFFLSLGAVAQGEIKKDKIRQALFFFQNGRLDLAHNMFKEAKVEEQYASQSKLWYYSGYVNKELYNQYKKAKNDSALMFRDESVSDIKKALTMELSEDEKGKAGNILKYLSNTIYNEAVEAISNGNPELAVTRYEDFKSTILTAVPNMDLTDRDIKFNLALASVYGRLNERSPSKDYEEKITASYNKVLTLDSNNYSANYNLAIFYYNQAVNIIENIDYEADIMVLMESQDAAVGLFQQALPFMLKAYELKPDREEVLIGLQGIYYSLNDDEKSTQFKNLAQDAQVKRMTLEELNTARVKADSEGDADFVSKIDAEIASRQ